jgi:hypothetical protein
VFPAHLSFLPSWSRARSTTGTTERDRMEWKSNARSGLEPK